MRIAKRIKRRGAGKHHGIGTVDHLHGGFNALGKVVRLARVIANDLARDLGIGIAAEFNALADEVGSDAIRIYQRAVVGKRNKHLVDGRHMRLSTHPAAHAATRRITAMANGNFAAQRRQRAFVEYLGDEPQVFRNRHGVAIAHRNARALLAAVLQGLQAEACKPRHVVGGGVHSEHRALFFKPIWLFAGKDRRCHPVFPLAGTIRTRRLRPRKRPGIRIVPSPRRATAEKSACHR